MNHRLSLVLAGVLSFAAASALAEAPASSAPGNSTAQALDRLSWMDGQWRGTAWVLTRKGAITITQTERSGTLLGGAVRMVEGSGYRDDGTREFNALGVIAARPDGSLEMHSWAQGQAGIFPVTVTEQGFSWSISAGPAVIRYEARLVDGKWIETGERVVPGQPPIPIIRMELTRIGDSDWPSGGAVPPK